MFARKVLNLQSIKRSISQSLSAVVRKAVRTPQSPTNLNHLKDTARILGARIALPIDEDIAAPLEAIFRQRKETCQQLPRHLLQLVSAAAGIVVKEASTPSMARISIPQRRQHPYRDRLIEVATPDITATIALPLV